MASPTNTKGIEAVLANPPSDMPSDLTLEFLQESRDRGAIIAILVITSFVVTVVALRSYARYISVRGFGLDDWLALLALATLIPFTVLAVILINLGSGRHFAYIQYVLDNAIVSRTEALDFWAHLVYTTCLLVCRLSGLAFFSRIADRQKKLTWAIRITAGVMIALWIPQMALIIFHCIPVTAYWPYAFEVNAEKYKCLQWGIVYVTNSAISLLCDLALFTIPAIIIIQLRVSKFDKLKLAGIMMPGLLVIAISCTRMYLVIVGQWQADQSWSYNSLLTIEVAEIGSTLVALSVPALKPFFGKIFAFLDGTFVSHASSGSTSGTGSRRASLFRLANFRKKDIEISDKPGEIRVRHSLAIDHEMLGDRKWNDASTSAVVSSAREHSVGSDHSEEPIIR
ncbi:hypothetical protein Q7P35_009681 [Cladosporium inversicolor]